MSVGWEKVLDEYHVGWVILPINEPLLKNLQEDLGWHVVYQDTTAMIVHQ